MISPNQRRLLFWILFLALIGAFVQTKSATIIFEDILLGLLVGGGAGLFLGSLLNLILKK